MTKKTFLVEIGTEELPAKKLKNISLIFYKNFINELKKNNISYKKINYFSTPRRLALQIIEINTSEKTKKIIKKGPAIKNAFDENGNPTIAAQNWAKNYKVNLNQTQRLKNQKGEWLIHYAEKKQKKIELLLPIITEVALKNINVNSNMRWEGENIKFIRPIRNIVMLLDNIILKEAIIFHLRCNNILQSHISSKEEKIYITDAKEYPSILFKKSKIIAHHENRKEQIKYEINKIAKKVNGAIKKDSLLLEEVTSLVESPKVLLANLKKDYTDKIPQEIIGYIIKKQQKCFPIYSINEEKNILPYFIFITNIHSQNNKNIILGNEKVMHARLSDAIFFLKKDRKSKLKDYLKCLKNISFYKGLGTLYQKTLRLVFIVKKIFFYTKEINEINLIRATLLSKCDLVTEMVSEFPELQGTIGMYYALENKEKKEVAIAIKEQYLPSFSTDKLPSTPIGSVLSIADKIDTISGMFSIGEIPGPEKDPFGLKRATLGVIRIIIIKKIPINLKRIIEISLEKHNVEKSNISVIFEKIKNFFIKRLIFFYENQKYNINIVQSVLAYESMDLLDIDEKIKAISNFKKIESIILIVKRISNFLKDKHEKMISTKINERLLIQIEERKLLEIINDFNYTTKQLFIEKKYTEILLKTKLLIKPINTFFKKVQINHEDIEIQKNRVILLIKLRKIFLQITNFSYLY
ncbi:glycine--tRNA ligase subunit beta [Buchnera aphidicola]|uniref:glycine--tRNA ligase subunit beta n=1 Tax=Buchnera aphidicola TaxID=9 RepID=UPI0034648FF1